MEYLLPAVPISPAAPLPALTLPVPTGGGRERVLRALYLARLSLASAIFLAAIVVWRRADSTATLLATMAFISSLFFTGGSMFFAARRPSGLSDTFFYLQIIFDLWLVTAVVHLTQTGGAPSPLAPVYILVIAISALLLPPAGVVLIAILGDVLYFAITIADRSTVVDGPVMVQLAIFGVVALGCGYIGARLREAHAGREEMAAELAAFRLREADIERLHTRAERLEAVAELSASLAHEIKNPLASIRSAAELLAKVPGSDDDTRTLTKLVQRESDRLSRLLSEFLDFARTGVTSVRKTDLVEIAHHAADLVARHPSKPENVLIREVFPSKSLVVVGDDDLLHRAIFNLLLNAVQASSPGGEVVIEASELSHNQLPSQASHFTRGALMIEVTDNGRGIADSIKERLFEPFVTTKSGGSGLGLSIVHRAVEAHHGFILVDNNVEGSGTKFTVILPKLGNEIVSRRRTPKSSLKRPA